jgi:hypothetical protein
MAKYAVIVTATGEVINVIVWDGITKYIPDEGTEVREATEPAMIGGTWDGSKFILPWVPPISRLVRLMQDEAPPIEKYDEETGTMVARLAEDIAADKVELLGLLQTKLIEVGDLTREEINKMLVLERELQK